LQRRPYLARRGPQGPADPHVHNCIRLRLSTGGFIPWKFIIQGKTVEVEVEGPLILDDPELVISAAVDGIGVAAYIDEDYVTSAIVDGQLVRVLEDIVLGDEASSSPPEPISAQSGGEFRFGIRATYMPAWDQIKS